MKVSTNRVEQAERAKERILRTGGIFLASLLLLKLVVLGYAQTGNLGSIEGTATDPSGAVISRVEVTVRKLPSD